jgi:hypothetical protein
MTKHLSPQTHHDCTCAAYFSGALRTLRLRLTRRIALAIFVLAVALSGRLASAQGAAVTIYTPYRTATQQLAEDSGWSKSQPAWGRVFDGEQELATMRTSRFVTFQIPAGLHVFSARFDIQHHAGKKNTLNLDMKEGARYYLRFTSTAKDIVTTELDLKETECAVAVHESEKSRPLEVKYVPAEARRLLLKQASMPACP